jgi:hypothetical protein
MFLAKNQKKKTYKKLSPQPAGVLGQLSEVDHLKKSALTQKVRIIKET